MSAQELRVSKQTLIQTKTALDTSFEQAVEKDFVLPDYCPDVFRILKCRVCPHVTSQSINGDKLTVDTEAEIKVMYLSENSSRISLLEHKLSFTKTLDLGSCTAPIITASAALDYVNCRVVNQRRVDIRGAFTVEVKVEGESRMGFVTAAEGAGIQLRKAPAVYPAERLTASKRITVIEELELGGAKPPIGAVLRTDCRIEPGEQRVIQGKLITKGEAMIDLLYTPTEQSEEMACTMRFGLPFSQIIDIEGIDESFTVTADITAAGCEVIPRADEGSRLECELVLLISCTAVKYESCEAVTDAYSTLYDYSAQQSGFTLSGMPRAVCAEFSSGGALKYQDGELGSVACACCDCGNVTLREQDGRSIISGSLTLSAVCRNTQGGAVYLENEVPFEFPADCRFAGDINIQVKSCGYQLSDSSTVEIKTELTVTGTACDGEGIAPLGEITVDTDKPVDKDPAYAIKLCYVEAGQELWELAKRCRTGIEAIIEENELPGGRTESSGLLLIPLIS